MKNKKSNEKQKKEYEEHTRVDAETSEEFIRVGGMVTRSLAKKDEKNIQSKTSKDE